MPAARDLILGMEVILPSGERVRSGGRVVKNVTGYDMHRMHTGALGAFGVIVEASFKVAPLPEATRTLHASTPNLAAAAALAGRLWDASPALRALSVLTPRAAVLAGLTEAPTVLLELAGTARTVDRSTADLRAVTPLTETPSDSWRALRAAEGDATRTVLRAGVPPTAVRELLELVERTGGTAWAHYAAGAVVVAYDDPASAPSAAEVARLRTEAERLGGFLLIESAPAALRHEVPASSGDAVLVEALRDRFDPSRTINRGRWGAIL